MSVTKSHKVYADAVSALQGVVKDGITLMVGGFGACGIPENLTMPCTHRGARAHRGLQQCGVGPGGPGIAAAKRIRSKK